MRINGRIGFTILCFFIVLAWAFVTSGCSPKDDASVAKTEAPQFTIKNKGSDTMVNLAQAWAEKYTGISATASVEVSGGGSGTGVAALINGTVDIANCSRQIKPTELALATQNTGKVPQEYIVGYDALAVYVHQDTPIDKITITQLAEIYGENGTITKWSDLGISHSDCPSDKIIRISRQSNSGTYFYFREALLGKNRDFGIGSLDLHGSKDVVEVVGRTPCAIGYSGMGYATSHVKMLEVATDFDAPYYPPTLENVLAKTYPIARPLYMYSLGEPTGAVKIYLDWILSAEGQKIVEKLGFVPLDLDSTIDSVIEPLLTKDEKRFFWATLNVEGVILAPSSEISWATQFLLEHNMSDSEFESFMLRVNKYREFVINHPDKVNPPEWAVGRY